MKKVLFVCLGNICRSPAAEGSFIKLLKERNLTRDFVVDSAGTGHYHQGELPDSRMIQEAGKRDIVLPSRARQFKIEDFQKFDFIIAMDENNLRDLKQLDRQEQWARKLFLMTDFRVATNYREVPDPYYGDARDFNLVLDIVWDCSQGLLERILQDKK